MAGPLNIPSVTTADVSFGPGILKLGPAGTTPSVDLGAVRSGASLEIQTTNVDLRQGNPDMLIKRYIQSSDVQFTVTGLEWDFDTLVRALGAGVTQSNQFDFGGEHTAKNVALEFTHRMPAGHTIAVRVWEAVSTGEMSINFGEDLHEFPATFQAVRSETDWSGASLSDRNQYFRIVRITS